MSNLKRNVIANYIGSAWVALIGLAFVPFYIRLMGVEAYGIVGVFASLQAVFAVLDLGLSNTLNREMARLRVSRGDADTMADTARTVEIIYLVLALIVTAAVALLSFFISHHWLNPEQLSKETLFEALLVMALVIGLRWQYALYMGGLNGLQRQILVNMLLCIFVVLQSAGALAVLWLIEPTIRAYFTWQALIALMQVLVFRVAFWRTISSDSNGNFRKGVLVRIWRFAAGISGITILATVLTQIDKILLSKLLPLTEFGYYTFAATVAGVLFRLIGPIFTAYYPRLTELVSKGDENLLSKAYHHGSELIAAAVLPFALVLAFFSLEILEIWARNPGIVNNTYLIISVLTIGNAMNGLMNLPYALQLAHGWTKLTLYTNLVAVVILVPAIYFATLKMGGLGAAIVWMILNLFYLLVVVQLMHRRILRSEKWFWYVNDIGKPLIVTSIIVIVGRVIINDDSTELQMILSIAAVSCLAVIGVVVSSAFLRQELYRQLYKLC